MLNQEKNFVALSGIVGPRIVYLKNEYGVSVLKFSIEILLDYKIGDDFSSQEYRYIDVCALGDKAEFLLKNLNHGMRLSLEGSIAPNYLLAVERDRDSVEVLIEEILLLEEEKSETIEIKM